MPIMPNPCILVVENDINLLEGIRTILALEHYDVLTAEDGEEALAHLRRMPVLPDVIVSDIMMPRMDGLQLLGEIRKNVAWLGIPVIFLTARSERADIMYGKRLGVDDYLVKPFDAEDLLVAIESRLKRHQLLRKAKTEEVTDIKRKILTILNHEFRTPLTFLVAYTDMLTEQENHSQQGDTALFLHGINVGALRLRRLIENFIHLVEMETGDAERMFEMRKMPLMHLRDVLNTACDALSEYYPERRFDVNVADVLPGIVADPIYLGTAITHLLDNAQKFSHPHQPIVLSAYEDGEFVIIEVMDHGRGIDPTEQARIWESFYQINRAVYEDQGAGSGLAIVRGVARLHGGMVTLDSEPGKGSTFKLHLPIATRESLQVFGG